MRNFKPEDFSGSGQYLIRADKDAGQYKSRGFMSTITKKVGYCLGQGLASRPDGNVATLTDMSDGLTTTGYFDTRKDPDHRKNPREAHTDTWVWVQFDSKEILCEYLNDPDLSEAEYRFAAPEEVLQIVMYQTTGNTGNTGPVDLPMSWLMFTTSPEDVPKVLNALSAEGVKMENIRVAGGVANGSTYVYYRHHDAIIPPHWHKN